MLLAVGVIVVVIGPVEVVIRVSVPFVIVYTSVV